MQNIGKFLRCHASCRRCLAHEQKEKDSIKFWTHNKETQKKKELEVGQIYSVFLFQAKFHTVVTQKQKSSCKVYKRQYFGRKKTTKYTPYFKVKKKPELDIFTQ
jgi:hypothetical protein